MCVSSRDTTTGASDSIAPATMEPYHRAEFLQVLTDHAPEKLRTHFCKKLVSYVDNALEPLVMQFQDGTTATCDVLVGADGIKSAVRKSMYNQMADRADDEKSADQLRRHVHATWTGQVAYRHLILAEDLKNATPDHPGLRQPVMV